MSTVDDWLALHRLPKQDLNDWLQECQKHADVVRHDGLEDNERKHEHHDQAAIYVLPQQDIPGFVESQVLPAFHLMLGVPWAQLCQAVARSRWTLHTDPNRRSYARWDDPTQEVDVRLHHVDGCVSPLTVAHEFVHVLQALQAQARPTPPVLREAGAFLGELALIGFEAGLPASTRRQYRRIWRQDNQYYLGTAGQLLAASLAQPNQPYRYAINYPLARTAALWAAQDWAGAHTLAARLIDPPPDDDGLGWLAQVLQTTAAEGQSHTPPPTTPVHGQHPWTQMKEAFARTLQWPNDADLWHGADGTICCLYANAPRPFAFLQSQGFDAEHRVCRCAYDGGRADWLRLGGIFGQALHATSDKKTKNQVLAHEVGQLMAQRAWPVVPSNEAPIRLRLAEAADSRARAPEHLEQLFDQTPSVLGAMLAGQIDWRWLQLTTHIKAFAFDGVAEDGSPPSPSLVHRDATLWALGCQAIALSIQATASEQVDRDLSGQSIERFVATQANRQQTPSGPVVRDRFWVLGLMLTALAQADYHRGFPIQHYVRVELIPAIERHQFWCFWDAGGEPGFVTWAWVSPSVQDRLHHHGHALGANEWQTGSNLFFNDWVTPGGLVRAALRFCTRDIFPDDVATSLRRNADASVRKINRWTGVNRRRPSGQKPAVTQPCPGEQWLSFDPGSAA